MIRIKYGLTDSQLIFWLSDYPGVENDFFEFCETILRHVNSLADSVT